MFGIRQLLESPPAIKIIDVGAMSLGAERDPYAKLVGSVPCEVIGFEPVLAECERLNRRARPGCRYLPYAVADGARRTFHECNLPMTSSLLEPDETLFGMFHELGEITQVVARREVQTVRLDDVAEARDADYLKLDVQGGELLVLQGARGLLRRLLVVHSEVEFLPMYKQQPLFADIDTFLRENGFILHKISGMKAATFKLPGVEVELTSTVNQAIWAETVYVPDFRALERLDAAALLKLAVILHENYGSTDLAARALAVHDRKAGTDLTDRYLELLFNAESK